MNHLSETDQALVREQSAALAAVLDAGLSETRGGSAPLPPTKKQQQLLNALKAAPRGAATPAELMVADPEWFAGVPVRSATFSLHRTADSLVNKGLVKRGRRNSGPRLYRITEAGRQASRHDGD